MSKNRTTFTHTQALIAWADPRTQRGRNKQWTRRPKNQREALRRDDGALSVALRVLHTRVEQ